MIELPLWTSRRQTKANKLFRGLTQGMSPCPILIKQVIFKEISQTGVNSISNRCI